MKALNRQQRKIVGAVVDHLWNEEHRPRDLDKLDFIFARALVKAGLTSYDVTDEEIRAMSESFQRQLDERKPVTIDLVSEKEYETEIEAAKARGEYVSAKR
jgi:hypothetical protein